MIRRWAGMTLAGVLLMMEATASAFEFTKEAVSPRIFSPNGDGINDIVTFRLAGSSLDTVVLRIYDQNGSLVAEARPVLGDDPVWDGKDGNGNTVRAGIYIYEIRGSEKSVTGTVVVAK